MRTNPVLWNRSYWITCIVLLAFAVVLALPRVVRATVDCSGHTPGAFTSIQDAINALPEPPPGGQNVISILSDCTESVSISGQHRLVLFGGPQCGVWCSDPPVKITGVPGPNGPVPVLSISGSQDVTIDGLILTGGGEGLQITGGSSVTGSVIKVIGNSGNGISVYGGASLYIGDGGAVNNGLVGILVGADSSFSVDGNTPWFPNPQPFLISGNGFACTPGAACGGIEADGTLAIGGGVTIQDNAGFGIMGVGGNSMIGAWHGENVIQHNPIGVACYGNARCLTYGPNTIQNNDTIGVHISSGGVGDLTEGTIIQGNRTVGVEVDAHSHAAFYGTKVSNNGSSTEPLRAGISVDGTSHVALVGGNEVTGNIGPGIFADINSSLDVTDTTISGNTEEGIRVRHMSVAEIQGATTMGGNHGGPVTCDSRSLVITNLIPSTPRCANIEGAPGGPKPRSASAMRTAPNVAEMMQKARQMAERFKQQK